MFCLVLIINMVLINIMCIIAIKKQYLLITILEKIILMQLLMIDKKTID